MGWVTLPSSSVDNSLCDAVTEEFEADASGLSRNHNHSEKDFDIAILVEVKAKEGYSNSKINI